MAATNLFTTQDLSLSFNVGQQTIKAVIDANITIPEGEITIIFGASGSGKSSLLNIISGLQAPSSGKIHYQKHNIYTQTANELAYYRAHELGIVYQTNYWVKSLNALDNVAMPLFFMGYERHQAHQIALESLKTVSMESYANKLPILLSGGEQQRVAMARALVGNPSVIIADEPTGNLDSKNGDMIMSLLSNLNQQHKKTIILVTHNLEYLPMADHLIEIEDGKVSEINKADIPKTIETMLGEVKERLHTLSARSKHAS